MEASALKISMLVLIGTLCGALACSAESIRDTKGLTFQDILATRQSDSRLYVLVGSGWLRGIRFGDPGKYVSQWLREHPSATVTPISRMLNAHVSGINRYLSAQNGQRGSGAG